MNLNVVILVLCATILVAESKGIQKKEKIIFCYYESWTIYRPLYGTFDENSIDPHLCTHISFAFLGLNTNGSILEFDPWQSEPGGLDGFRRLVAIKKNNKKLKIMVTMGGWNEGSAKFSQVAADPDKRAVLVKEVVALLEKYRFNGFDLDWQYPARIDSNNPADKENYVILLQELKTAFKPKKYLLSAAVNGGKRNIDVSYNISAVSSIVDFINVMSFDFHGPFEDFVGHPTPLYAAAVDASHNNSEWNVNDGIQYLIKSGAPPAKLNLGIATYGRTFTLADRSKSKLYDKTTGGGKPGRYSNITGYMGFNEICQFYNYVPDIVDTEQLVPHKVERFQWIGYENQDSIKVKASYAIVTKLGGFAVWSLATDDFAGRCGYGQYPLISTLNTTLTEHGYKMKTYN